MTGYQDDPVPRFGPGGPPSAEPPPRPLNVRRLWAGGVATAVVAVLIALVGVLVVRTVLRLAPNAGGAVGSSGVTTLCGGAAVAALAATGLAHLLLTTTPRPLTYLSWIVGLATAVAVVVPLATDPSLGLALARAVIHLVVGMAIGSLVITAARASRPPYPMRGFPIR